MKLALKQNVYKNQANKNFLFCHDACNNRYGIWVMHTGSIWKVL
jgi:hypothetical protein